jgi:hypothetical protein
MIHLGNKVIAITDVWLNGVAKDLLIVFLHRLNLRADGVQIHEPMFLILLMRGLFHIIEIVFERFLAKELVNLLHCATGVFAQVIKINKVQVPPVASGDTITNPIKLPTDHLVSGRPELEPAFNCLHVLAPTRH